MTDQQARGEVFRRLLGWGCPDRSLLDHCRHYTEHFGGCAALDRLLGR